MSGLRMWNHMFKGGEEKGREGKDRLRMWNHICIKKGLNRNGAGIFGKEKKEKKRKEKKEIVTQFICAIHVEG